MRRTVLWFRNDLRIHDNPIVAEAIAVAKKGEQIVPVYCFDPRFTSAHNVLDQKPHTRLVGDPKMSGFRAKFLMECVNDLRRSLRSLGSDLLVFYDKPENVIPGLLPANSTNTVLTMEESTSEELAVDSKVRAAISSLGRLKTIWGHTMFHIDDLPYAEDLSDLPDTFTPCRKVIEAKCRVRAEVATPKQGELGKVPVEGLPAGATEDVAWEKIPLESSISAAGPPEDHPKAALHFKGGESEGLARLQFYLWDKDLIAEYFNTRNNMVGGDYSTKFSPWLAAGCLSPRRVHHEVRRYENARVENKSTYWVIFELIWRDYFRFFAVKHGSKIFFEGGIIGKQLEWSNDNELLEMWKEGRTGMPLVDANMRELSSTGFMSNRGRQNVASYLVLDLGVDWRLGASWFEQHLIDHDVTSNFGNWVSAAGLTGGRINKFNITKQSKDYDLSGKYVKHWLPELEKVPISHVHEPWTMPKSMQEEAGCIIGTDYPHPVPVARMARPWQGSRYPDAARNEQYGSRARARPTRGKGSMKGGSQGRGRAPVNFY